MRKLYKRKLDILRKIGEPYAEWLSISGDQAGMHVVIDCQTHFTGEQLRTKLAEIGIRISALDHYRINRTTVSSKLLLGFGGIPEEKMEPALNDLFEQLAEYCIQKEAGT